MEYLAVGSILAVHLSRRMPQCDFTYHSDASRAIVEMLRKRELDIGLVATPQDRPEGLSCHERRHRARRDRPENSDHRL